MTAEVDWVLETIKQNLPDVIESYGTNYGAYYGSVYAGYGTNYSETYDGDEWDYLPIERIDRDSSKLLEGNYRSRTEELTRSNFIGATHADTSTEPIGTEYDHRAEVVVGVRIEGLHADEWGCIDPDASIPPAEPNGPVPFDALVRAVRIALLSERSYPTVDGAFDSEYHTALITNDSPGSAAYRDYYRYDFDVVLQGDETLPTL